MLFTDEPNVVNDRKEVNNYSGKVYVTHTIHLLAVPCEFEDYAMLTWYSEQSH